MVGHTELAGSVLGSVLGAFLLKPVGYNKTQSGCFRLDEAYFSLQTRVECPAAEAELVSSSGCAGVPLKRSLTVPAEAS